MYGSRCGYLIHKKDLVASTLDKVNVMANGNASQQIGKMILYGTPYRIIIVITLVTISHFSAQVAH
jgi:hypothetical protein